MSDNRSLEDSQEISHITNEHAEIAALRAKRRNGGHCAYGIIAGSLSGAALFVWGCIFTHAWMGPPEPISATYLAVIAVSIVLGITAAAATFTWMITRIMQSSAADEDRIRDYDRQQIKKEQQRIAADSVNAVLDALDHVSGGSGSSTGELINGRLAQLEEALSGVVERLERVSESALRQARSSGHWEGVAATLREVEQENTGALLQMSSRRRPG